MSQGKAKAIQSRITLATYFKAIVYSKRMVSAMATIGRNVSENLKQE